MIKLKTILLESNILLERNKLRIFDFDDTLVKTQALIKVKKSDGKVVLMNSHEYATYVAEQGDEFDFSDFDYVVNPQPLVFATHILKAMLSSGGNRLITILTARAKSSVENIKSYLKTIGFNTIDVVALQSSDPFDKAKWIEQKVAQGYDDVTFIDDSKKNIEAVKTVKQEHPNIKLKVIHVGPKS